MRARFLTPCVALALLAGAAGASTAQSIAGKPSQRIAALTKQAASGDAKAQFALGLAYDNGDGVPQDNTQAAMWFRKAAEQRDVGAEYFLGVAYLFGEGMPADQTLGVSWIRKAAEHGQPSAQTDLAHLYLAGKYVPQDYNLAASWYRKAAERGNPDGQAALASLYERGTGVAQDYSEAYFWMSLAAANPELAGMYSFLAEQDADERHRIASHLTKSELLKAQEKARKWFAAHQSKAQ